MNIEYNCHDDKLNLCHKKRKKIKIVHAHGSLWQYPDVPYGLKTNDPSILKKAAERIKIISDRLDDSYDFQEAQRLIAESSNIVFFGFGYDEITLSKLLGASDISSKIFYGTSIQLTSDTRTMLQNKFGDKLISKDNLDCRNLLEEIRLAMK